MKKKTKKKQNIANQLLIKIYKKKNTEIKKKLLFTNNHKSSKNNNNRNNRYYGWIKRAISDAKKGTKHSSVTKRKISEKVKKYYETHSSHRKGIPNSAIQKKKISNALKGRIITEEHRAKISKSNKKPKSEEHKKKLQGINNPSYILVDLKIKQCIVDDYINGMTILDICSKYSYSEGKIQSVLTECNIDYKVRICIHCGKTGSASNMIRWHFEKCKFKKEENVYHESV